MEIVGSGAAFSKLMLKSPNSTSLFALDGGSSYRVESSSQRTDWSEEGVL